MSYKDYQQEICPMKGSAYCGYVVQMSRKVDDVLSPNTLSHTLTENYPFQPFPSSALCLFTFFTEPSLNRFQINPYGFCLYSGSCN